MFSEVDTQSSPRDQGSIASPADERRNYLRAREPRRIELDEVSFSGAATITARVPAGMPIGRHDLAIIDANGRRDVLIGAYEVYSDSSPSDPDAGVDAAPPDAGLIDTTIDGRIDGLRLELACQGHSNINPTCATLHGFNIHVPFGGDPGTRYRMTMNVRGVVELATYAAGSARSALDGQFLKFSVISVSVEP